MIPGWFLPQNRGLIDHCVVTVLLLRAPVRDEFIDYLNLSQGDDPPVTAVASRQVRVGREREFEEWVSGILAAANKFPGYLGSEILRPSDPEDNKYKIIFRFDHASNLHTWENSEERQRWLRKSRSLLYEEEKVHVLTGLET
jgi:antibiotic biosynthesis monooxygenase (ABM) superfamily enzyme